MATRLDLAPDLVIWQGDVREALKQFPDESVQCVVTSPPYFGLRNYGVEGQIGLESTVEEYVQTMVEVFREVRRVLRKDGTLWLNLGDSYNGSGGAGGDYGEGGLKEGQPKYPGRRLAGLKPKDLIGVPWAVAFALRDDGWYLRSDIIWHKPNPMPESVTDRPTKAHEYMFLLSKSAQYYYDHVAIMERALYGEEHARKTTSWGTNRKHPNKANVEKYAFKGDNHTTSRMTDGSYGRNKRSVWTVPTRPFSEAHFAVYPPDLIEPCILAGTSPMACPHCGAPWRRVVERTGAVNKRDRVDVGDFFPHKGGNPSGIRSLSGATYQPQRKGTNTFEPTCSCEGNDGSGKCWVLDPFLGSGTTASVALEHGRAAIGCELNAEYIEIAKRRLRGVQTTLLGRV